MKNENCKNCGGSGFTVEIVAACCQIPNPSGYCCGAPEPEQQQIPCPCNEIPEKWRTLGQISDALFPATKKSKS